MLKSLMVGLVGLSLSTAAITATAAEEEGYTLAPNEVHLGSDDSKINVTEVFWYGCPHCYALEDPLNNWVADLPEDVEFERLPAIMGDSWRSHAQAYFAAEELGIIDKTHEDFFDAMHQDGRRFSDLADIADFFSDYDVSEEDALSALNSFGVKSQINRSQATTRNLQLMGVPALVVDGRYIVSPSSAGSLENMPKVASRLVEKVREERAGQAEAE
ncbi:thiol:disulfide interchange protein DsbA/DsbL [Halomonas huangheensis]|uniref:Thiol:disulfide interchange protein n=1 Tax=Halomonas huangheensis TaxID=1178482 RepID=W1N6U7_9GAMM|nr:thiol:disulfide interchange protein DsbA/DsbL [Halomonas huangheensis]ALM51012.1 disulfide bond formation protein DsbA [Halomonas huangheensis]ERL51243.1 hypothetical protein BJB45_15180 [Halomonas huangheensis]